MHGFVAPTDHGWYQFLRARPEITEVNFWRPGGNQFRAVPPGAPFFFKLKRPHNAIGGFGLFARAERLPVWRAWDVFGQANGTRDEHELLLRLDRLGGRDPQGLGRNRMIGCVAITEPVFFAPDEWVDVPVDWSRNIVSGRVEDLSRGSYTQKLWMRVKKKAAYLPGC
jgi:putative restriction endonuclease